MIVLLGLLYSHVLMYTVQSALITKEFSLYSISQQTSLISKRSVLTDSYTLIKLQRIVCTQFNHTSFLLCKDC